MRWYGLWLVITALLINYNSGAQIRINGIVKDGKTGQPLSFVAVGFPRTGTGSLTGDDGSFSLETAQPDSLRISMIGYRDITLWITAQTAQPLTILLQEQGTTLDEVSINGNSTGKYRNKDNPAVDLIRKVIDHKEQNYTKGTTNTTYRQYEQLLVSLLRTPDSSKTKEGSWSDYVRRHADTTRISGKALLPIYVREKATEHYYNAATRKTLEQNLGEKKTSLDGIVDENGLQAYFDKIYAGIDVYDNNILLGDQQLLSPIAGMGPAFYKYFITDTLKDEQPWKVQLSFFPRNPADPLFKGTLLVTLDSSFAVTDVEMTVNKHINLNWVHDLKIDLQYRKHASGIYYQQQSALGMSLSALGTRKGLYGERIISRSHFDQSAQLPVGITSSSHVDEAPELPETEWVKLRPASLNTARGDAFANLDTLKNMPSFKRAVNIFTLLLSGYEVLGPVEIGPVSSFYSFNPVEGLRLKLGGRTTDVFSKQFMLEGHAAYGFRDKQWKYNAGITYSLTGRSVFRFPVRAISVRHSYETQIPGQEMAFMEEDNFLLSFKRGDNSKWLYNKQWNIEYLHETRAHLSFRAGFNHSIQTPAGSLVYRPAAPESGVTKDPAGSLTLSEFTGEIRWAPNEEFYQGKKFRRPVFNAYPIFTLRGTVGVKGLWDAGYSYQSLTLNVFKRFYLSQLGFSDVVLEGGKVFGSVPFPLLYMHKANQSYAYQLYSYNLMNFMEFASDRYVSLHIDHSFNGFFLNKVPLVKKLQLRETASFKALYGTIGNSNLPGNGNKGLFDLPVDGQGRMLTQSLERGPYIEASVGISNIFKILRLDLVKRFTYLDNPGISEWGLRARMVLAL